MTRADFYNQIQQGGGIADLSARAKFKLTGSDRLRFLNGQVSNDVRKAAPDKALYACVMTAKGKMSGDVFITLFPDWIFVDAAPELRETLQARLERYIISDDVQLEDVTESFTLLHVLPGSGDLAITHGVKAARFGKEGRDLLIPLNATDNLPLPAVPSLPRIDPDLGETLRIEAGVPQWGAELTEETLPAEAGLDKTAVDFHKGCYIGQEIVSRIKSVGHVNKSLCGFVSDAVLSAGWRLFAPENPDKEVGRLTSCAYSFALSRNIALGYLRRGIESTVLHARPETGSAGCMAERHDLPFTT